MKYVVCRLATACLVMLSVTAATAQFGGMGGFSGGMFPGGGFGGGAWRSGGGIAGGGWNCGGFPGAGGGTGVGFAPGIGFVGPSAATMSNQSRQGMFTGFAPGWSEGFPPQATGFNNGMGGIGGAWSNTHPYSWCNGHWHNHWRGNGFGGYGNTNSPLGWGLGGWGNGRQWYNSGYVPYYNPYHIPVVAGPYSYGKPIPVPAGAKLADTNNPDVALAIDKFRNDDYAGALAILDGVIRVQPYDAAAHELRSLTLFALGEYQQAAETVHSVLAVGPGWDWTTLSSVYADIQTYDAQLAALEKYVTAHPEKADARFLLAYHYLTAGHAGAAKEQLEKVVALVPEDKLAAKLLRMIGRPPAGGQPAAPPPAALATNATPADPAVVGATAKPVDAAALVGDWHAKRNDGSAFELDLKADDTFAWKMSNKNQSRTITGKYTLQNATLTLQGANQGSMVAQVSGDSGDRFTFKPLGGPPDDPGLTFSK